VEYTFELDGVRQRDYPRWFYASVAGDGQVLLGRLKIYERTGTHLPLLEYVRSEQQWGAVFGPHGLPDLVADVFDEVIDAWTVLLGDHDGLRALAAASLRPGDRLACRATGVPLMQTPVSIFLHARDLTEAQGCMMLRTVLAFEITHPRTAICALVETLARHKRAIRSLLGAPALRDHSGQLRHASLLDQMVQAATPLLGLLKPWELDALAAGWCDAAPSCGDPPAIGAGDRTPDAAEAGRRPTGYRPSTGMNGGTR